MADDCKELRDRHPNIFGSVRQTVSQYLTAARLHEKNRTYQEKPKDVVGDPLYTPDDLCGITNPVAILARLLCIKFGITKDEFNDKHCAYKRSLGKTNQQIATDKGNLGKNLTAPRMTIDKLEELVASLGYDIIDYGITVLDKSTGETVEFHSSGIQEYEVKANHRALLNELRSDRIESVSDDTDD